MIKGAKFLYQLLLAVWAVVVVWQFFEHERVVESARALVINRARDISRTMELVIRSQRWRQTVLQNQIKPALEQLLKSDDLKSVALLNAAGDTLVSAGEPIDFGTSGLPRNGELWTKTSVMVVNPVDLGVRPPTDGTNAPSTGPTILLPGGPRGRGGPPPRRSDSSNSTNLASASTNTDTPRDRDRRPPRPPDRFGPPQTEEQIKERQAFMEKQGLHDFALVLSTDAMRAACTHDLWLRAVVSGFALVSVIGFGLAWRGQVTASEFQMRLVRASEQNSHLREMNVAAAGLAHETRNPLNIIRGLAQMISKAPQSAEEVQKKSREITDEVDRVTVQLNEFINYSKPREVRRSPVAIGTVVNDVVRTLKSDLEDKSIQLDIVDDNLTVSADQQLLRQVVFNLLMNSIQAVKPGGEIKVEIQKTGPREACFEVRDNGPGVPVEQRDDIFRPYFTTREKGTGLGLAVVKQIILAHGWDVECLSNNDQGAVFRVSRIELAAS